MNAGKDSSFLQRKTGEWGLVIKRLAIPIWFNFLTDLLALAGTTVQNVRGRRRGRGKDIFMADRHSSTLLSPQPRLRQRNATALWSRRCRDVLRTPCEERLK